MLSGLRRSKSPTSRLIYQSVMELGSFLTRKRARGYVVGGFIRDVAAGRQPRDVDIAVDGIAPRVVADHLHRNLGFSRPAIFRRFRTALVARGGVEIEFSHLRGSLDKDAGMRDFTVNCLYADIRAAVASPAGVRILDPTGSAMRDLGRKHLRTPADPPVTIWLDPIRMLRAVRFYAACGFVLDRELRDCIRRMVYLLGRVSPERVRSELERILLSNRLSSSLRLMQGLGITDVIMPELGRADRYEQSTPYHAYDLLSHSIKTAARTPPDLRLRLAGLLHDLGKMSTRAETGGRAVYYGHQRVSADIAGDILRRLRFPKRLVSDVVFLVENHMINYTKAWTDKGVRRFVRRMGIRLDDMLLLVESDRNAQGPAKGIASNIRELRRRITELNEKGRIHLQLPIDGRDIMEILGVEQGPIVGQAKEFLVDEAAKGSGPLSRSECEDLLQSWAEERDLSSVIAVDKRGDA